MSSAQKGRQTIKLVVVNWYKYFGYFNSNIKYMYRTKSQLNFKNNFNDYDDYHDDDDYKDDDK